MRRPRFTISSLMVLVLSVAVWFAALRNPTPLWASAAYTLMLGLLLFSLLGIAYRRGDKQRFWLGFALFGWAHLIHDLHTHTVDSPVLLTTMAVGRLDDLYLPVEPRITVSTVGLPASYYFTQTAHSLTAILVGLFGTLVVRVFGVNLTERKGTTP